MTAINPPVGTIIRVAGIDLEFHPVSVPVPTPDGHQIAHASGCKPPDDAVVMRLLADGGLELIRPDQIVDVSDGDARFVALIADRVSLLRVNGERYEWPGRIVSGMAVRRMADVPADEVLRLQRTALPDKVIADAELVSLDPDGIERFASAKQTWELNVHGVIVSFDTPHVVVRDALTKAGIDPTKPWQIFLKIAGRPKAEVTLDETIDLTTPGIEKLRLMPRAVDNGEAPSASRRTFSLLEEDVVHLDRLGLVWETIVEQQRRWLLIRDYPLPAGFTVRRNDIALEIPPTYPQAQLYGFFAHPALALTSGHTIPSTQLSGVIEGNTFVGWSRYRPNQPWNPDTDNVVTQLALVEAALSKEAGE